MTKSIFVSLPVADLPRSVAFYRALGFVPDPAFSDDTAAAVALSEAFRVMLVTHGKWRTFTTRPICPAGASEVALAFTCHSREEVDRLVAAGAAHGGAADVNPPEDHGSMYQRTLADPDGHLWEPVWLDPAHVAVTPAAAESHARAS